MWFGAAFVNLLSAWGGELWFVEKETWYNYLWAECGLGFVLMAVYIVMIGFSGVALHRVRKSGYKKTKGTTQAEREEGV